MIDYLYKTSDLNLFLLLSIPLILISILALLFIRAYMSLHLRYQENAVIGCTSALIIVIYGVLAGFATLYLINNNNAATDATQREASTIANLYRDSIGLSEPDRTQIQTNIRGYLTQVLNMEWPLMNAGKTVTNAGDFIIEKIGNELNHYKVNNNTESLLVTDMLMLSDKLYDARQQRIQLSYISLNNEVWVVIIVSTILTLCVSYLFGINFYLHIFVAVASALMTAAIAFLLISLDKPFQGEFVVGPEPYQTIATYITR